MCIRYLRYRAVTEIRPIIAVVHFCYI